MAFDSSLDSPVSSTKQASQVRNDKFLFLVILKERSD